MKKAEEFIDISKLSFKSKTLQIEIIEDWIKQAQIDAIEATAKACEFNFVSGMRKLPIEMVVDELKKELE